jgi:hypothetical protein
MHAKQEFPLKKKLEIQEIQSVLLVHSKQGELHDKQLLLFK